MVSIPFDNTSKLQALDSILIRPAPLPATSAADRDESFEEHLHEPVQAAPAAPAPPQAAQSESDQPGPHEEEPAATEAEQIGGDETPIRGEDGEPEAERPEKEAVPSPSSDSPVDPPLLPHEVVAENADTAGEIEEPVVIPHDPSKPAAKPAAADSAAAAAVDTADGVLPEETSEPGDRPQKTIPPPAEPVLVESRHKQIAEPGPEIAVESKAGHEAGLDLPEAKQSARDSRPRHARIAAKPDVAEVQGAQPSAEASQEKAPATPVGTGTGSRSSDSASATAAATEADSTSPGSGSSDSESGVSQRSPSSGRIPPHLLTHRSDRAAAAARGAEVDQARLVQRVSRAIEAARGRGGDIRLRLSPPELGSMRLEVRVHGGALSARIEAETAAARSLLVDSLPMLRQRLAEQGIRIEHLDVDVRDPGSGGMSSGPRDSGDRTAGGMPGWGRHRAKPEPGHSDQPGVGPVVPRPQPGNGGLNVVV